MSSMFADMVSDSRSNLHCSSTGSLSPPSSESPGLTPGLEEQRTLQLALELSMLDLTDLHGNLSQLNHHMGGAMCSPTQQGAGLVPGSTLNAFTSMLVAAGNCMPGDDRSKKSQNMTECVPVPSSEHVAEIVGRQGKIKICVLRHNFFLLLIY